MGTKTRFERQEGDKETTLQVVNWLNLLPTDADWEQIIPNVNGVVHNRIFLHSLVQATLRSYPWATRSDLIPIFFAGNQYQQGDWIAFPEQDSQRLRPDTWSIGQVVRVEETKNPLQGEFRVVHVRMDGKIHLFASGVASAHHLTFDFPPEDPEDLGMLISSVVDKYFPSLLQALEKAIDRGVFSATIVGDEIVISSLRDLLTEEDLSYIADFFTQSSETVWLSTDLIIGHLRELGRLKGISDRIAKLALANALPNVGYISLGNDRWIPEDKYQQINRGVDRRVHVPRIRSKVAEALGEDDSVDFEYYDDIELTPEAQQAYDGLDEELPSEEIKSQWSPPSVPIQLPTFTYLHLSQGYFPLGKRLSKAFDMRQDQILVEIEIIDGDPIPFLVNRLEGALKALEIEALYEHFRYKNNIPAGTRLWIEYKGPGLYRIAPNPLPRPETVRCKLIRIENGNLIIDEADIPLEYEHDKNIFKAELRFEDLDALFAEAEKKDWRIFDAIYYTFKELAQKNPDIELHHTQVFNLVFFRHRMCSPRSVIVELYNRPCFVLVGNGVFRFDPNASIRSKPVKRLKSRVKRTMTPTAKKRTISHPQIEAEAPALRQEPHTPAYFIFQQRTDTEYADSTGHVYNWAQGIPGSNQIIEGARFIYYRPGDKVFFGNGHIRQIERYQGDDGKTYYNGIIEDFQNWETPLPLDEALFRKLDIYNPRRIWIGQAGIRKISELDYKTIVHTQQEQQQEAESGETTDNHFLQAPEPAAPTPPITPEDDPFWQQIIQVSRSLHTLGQQRSFKITRVTRDAVEIITSTGKERSIPREQIEAAWIELQRAGRLARTDFHDEISDFNPAYIAAILTQIPGVTHKVRPIRLFFRQGGQAIVPVSNFEATKSGQAHFFPKPPLFASLEGAAASDEDQVALTEHAQEELVGVDDAESSPTPEPAKPPETLEGTNLPHQNGQIQHEIIQEDNVNTREAFDTLINQMQDALQNTQKEGSRAFQQGKFADAQRAAQRAEAIKKHLQTMQTLRGEWNTLLIGGKIKFTRKQKAKRTHLSPGLKTPEDEYRLPILQALVELGGSGPVKKVLVIVEDLMSDRLNEYDRSLLRDGRTPRWRNTAQWVRQNMKEEGLVSANSPRGTWEITEAGKAYFRDQE